LKRETHATAVAQNHSAQAKELSYGSQHFD